MTEKDAQLGRTLMTDELDTINKYKRMADSADNPHTKAVLNDVAEEEKVHVGEGANIVDRNDPSARKKMTEGYNEATHIEESSKQTHFSPYTGKLQTDKPKVRSAEDYGAGLDGKEQKKKNTDKAKEIDKKNLTAKQYEEKWHESKTGKKLASARELFAQKRAEVIRKANGDERYGIDDEGNEYEKEYELEMEDDDDRPMDKVNDATKDLEEARNKGKGKKKTKIGGAGKNKDTTGFEGVNRKGELEVPQGVSEEEKALVRGQKYDERRENAFQRLDNPEIERQYREGELKTVPREDVTNKRMEHRTKKVRTDDLGRITALPRIDYSNVKERTVRDLIARYPKDAQAIKEAVDNGDKEGAMELLDVLLKKDKNNLDEHVMTRREEKQALRGTPMTPKQERLENQAKNPFENAAEGSKEAQLRDLLARLSPEERQELLRRLSVQAPGKRYGRYPLPKKKSASDTPVSEEHIEKKRSFGAESRKEVNNKNNKNASPRLSHSLGVYRDPFKGYFNTNDPAFRMRFDPRYSEMKPTAELDVPIGTDESGNPYLIMTDPTEFSMANYNRYNTIGGRRKGPPGTITDEDYSTLGGTPGSTQQVTARRVQARDMRGNPIWDEVREPVLTNETVTLDDGSTVFMPKLDANGDIVYRIRRKKRMVPAGNLIMTQRGKDLAYLQRYTGRLDTAWDEGSQQFLPVGIKADERGNIPKELFEGIWTEDGRIDPELAMERLRQLGYSGHDNRYVAPDISGDIDEFYRKAAYQYLVDQGRYGPDSKEGAPTDEEIAELAAQFRAQDEEAEAQRTQESKRRREDNYNADQALQDEAHNAAVDLYLEWLESADVDFAEDGSVVVHKVSPDGKPFDVHLSTEQLDAWVDANARAMVERYRKDKVRAATDEQKATVERARRGDDLTRQATEYYFNAALENLGHTPTPEEREELGRRAREYAEDMPFEQKAQLIERIRDKDWANIRNTMNDLPKYMHPDDIYHYSRAHDEDLERMRADAEATGTRAKRDRFFIEKLREIQSLSEEMKQNDPDARTLQLALDDIQAGRLQVYATENGPVIEYHGNDRRRGAREKDLIDFFFGKEGVLRLIGTSGDPTGDMLYLLRSVNRDWSNEYMYDAAEELGYAPEVFEGIVKEASAATSRQNKGGNDLSGPGYNEIASRLQSIVGNQKGSQGNSQFGALDEDIRQAYARGVEDDKNNMDAIVEAALPKALKAIKNNLLSGRYADVLDKNDMYFMNKLINEMDEPAQLDVLERLYRGAPGVGDPMFSPEMEKLLQRHIKNTVNTHMKEGRFEELFNEFEGPVTEYLTNSRYLDAAQAPGQPQAKVPEAEPKPTDDERLAKVLEAVMNPKTPKERQLSDSWKAYGALLMKKGISQDDAIKMLSDALVAGNFEKLDMTKLFSGVPKYKPPTDQAKAEALKEKNYDSRAKDPTKVEYGKGYDPENIMDDESAEKRRQNIENTLNASRENAKNKKDEKKTDPEREARNKGLEAQSDNKIMSGNDDLKPSKTPKTPEEKPKEKPKVDESEVNATSDEDSEEKKASASFKDVLSDKRERILKKYHGI